VRIGELADLVGVNPKTIRYYESIGLLPAPERQPSGYRDYTADDVERLRFVRTAQRLNLSLSEIAEILRFRERDERPCEYVLGVLDRQVAGVDRRMAEMAALRRELISLKAKADELPRDEGCYCAVIEHSQRPGGEPVTVSLGARKDPTGPSPPAHRVRAVPATETGSRVGSQ
jgi:DNA-binding transcriptional MerR regulator